MARKAKKSAKDEGEISLDDAVNVLRQAMSDGTAAPVVGANPKKARKPDVIDDGIIELTAMVKPPKGYRSLEDYRVRAGDRQNEALGGAVDAVVGSLISSGAGAELRQDLQDVIRPVLRKWLASHLQDIVSEVLEGELKDLGLSGKSKSSSK